MTVHTAEDRQADLSNRLRVWRVDAGLTLEEVADLTGLSLSMISRVERGQRELAPATKVKVARRLGVNIRDLFEVESLEAESSELAISRAADGETVRPDRVDRLIESEASRRRLESEFALWSEQIRERIRSKYEKAFAPADAEAERISLIDVAETMGPDEGFDPNPVVVAAAVELVRSGDLHLRWRGGPESSFFDDRGIPEVFAPPGLSDAVVRAMETDDEPIEAAQ